MADGGFKRFISIFRSGPDTIGYTDLVSGSEGTGSVQTGDTLTPSQLFFFPGVTPDAVGNSYQDPSYIDSLVNKITGFSTIFHVKSSELGGTISSSVFFSDIESPASSSAIPVSSEFTAIEFGGENELWGFPYINWNLGNFNNLLKTYAGIYSPSNDAVKILGSDSIVTPAYKIYYDPIIYNVTGWKRFNTLEDSGGLTAGTPSNLTTQYEGSTAQLINFFTTDPIYFILSDPEDFNIPSNAIIRGIEVKTTAKVVNQPALPSTQTWNIKLDTQSFSESDILDDYVTIDPQNTYDDDIRDFRTGSQDTLFGLDLTPSDLPNLVLGVKIADFGYTPGTFTYYTTIRPTDGSGEDTLARPAPAIRIFYEIPEPPSPEYIPGPSFISSTVDLTSFRGLGDRTSPLQSPPSSEDLFGFTSTIVPEGDNSSQATDSVFGDAANFGKLGLNRGGGTGISSTTGLLDTSKAPLSVRKGFRGI